VVGAVCAQRQGGTFGEATLLGVANAPRRLRAAVEVGARRYEAVPCCVGEARRLCAAMPVVREAWTLRCRAACRVVQSPCSLKSLSWRRSADRVSKEVLR